MSRRSRRRQSAGLRLPLIAFVALLPRGLIGLVTPKEGA